MLRNKKFIVVLCVVAAIGLILLAGCGWTTGPTFQGEYNPSEADPVTVVQNWMKAMEFKETTNDQGQTQKLPENGRDFDLWLLVSDPQWLIDPTTGAVASADDIQQYDNQWQATDWQVEFKDIQLELESQTSTEATVKISNGAVRYIGRQFFSTTEYKQDSFGDKPGEVFLRYYSDANDPLKNVPEVADRAVPRWVVVGGHDIGENISFPVQ